MNLEAAAIVLRPRSVTEILDLACRLSTSIALGLYTRLFAALLFPGFILCLALRHGLGVGWPLLWAIAVAWCSIAQGAFTLAIGRLLFSETLTARQVLSLFRRHLGSYLVTSLLARLVLAAASAPFFTLVPIAWPRQLFVHEVSLLEGAGPSTALVRSSQFVAGRVLGALGFLVALLATQAAFVGTSELLGSGLVSELLQLGSPFGSLRRDGGSAYALLGLFASVPYVATARFLAYLDSRTRADGWDIQLRFMAIAARETRDLKVAA